MQPPGNPGPGQDPYQQYPPGYGQAPQYSDPYSAPYEPASGSPYPPDPFAPQSSPPSQPAEYSLYPPISGPPPPPPPPPPQYPMGVYSLPVMQPLPMASNQGNTFGLLSMIFGIVSIPLLCCFYIGIPLGTAALVLGIIGTGKANRGEANNKGMAIAGIVCGGIGTLLGLLWLIAVFGFNASAPSHYY